MKVHLVWILLIFLLRRLEKLKGFILLTRSHFHSPYTLANSHAKCNTIYYQCEKTLFQKPA